uniref:CCHC-type domain-containing protein n=1 Tax=Salarias fasciatus TaxID=181472 RepID=A0A672H7Q9_SALFA
QINIDRCPGDLWDRFWRSTSPQTIRRKRRKHDRCYRCGEPGHVARNCPAPAPKSQAPGKRERSGAVRGSPLSAPTPRPDRCPLVGQCGHAKGLYLSCHTGTAICPWSCGHTDPRYRTPPSARRPPCFLVGNCGPPWT